MNKKIKIIDIFNIISKGDYEALPLNIQVDGNKYNWDNLEHFYKSRDDEDLLELARVYDTITFLDINVEVLDNNLEDNTEEIEELDKQKAKNEIWTYTDANINKSNLYCLSLYTEHHIVPKINELVKAVNSIRKDKNND